MTHVFYKTSGDKTEFYRSDNGGITLTNLQMAGQILEVGDEQKRTEIAVSPAAPDKIVASSNRKCKWRKWFIWNLHK